MPWSYFTTKGNHPMGYSRVRALVTPQSPKFSDDWYIVCFSQVHVWDYVQNGQKGKVTIIFSYMDLWKATRYRAEFRRGYYSSKDWLFTFHKSSYEFMFRIWSDSKLKFYFHNFIIGLRKNTRCRVLEGVIPVNDWLFTFLKSRYFMLRMTREET